jgi:hypothetical protein
MENKKNVNFNDYMNAKIKKEKSNMWTRHSAYVNKVRGTYKRSEESKAEDY